MILFFCSFGRCICRVLGRSFFLFTKYSMLKTSCESRYWEKKNTSEYTYALSEHINYPPLSRLLAKDYQHDVLLQLSAQPLSVQ